MKWALGDIIDVTTGINPVADIAAGANTGKRVHLRNYEGCGVLVSLNAHSAGTDSVVVTAREHNANTGGTSQNLAAIHTVYYKSTAAALAGTETWTELSNLSSGLPQATLTLTNAIIPAANQALVYFDVMAPQLSAGFEWFSIDIPDPGSGGTILGGVFYIMHGLKIQTRPDLLAQPNA